MKKPHFRLSLPSIRIVARRAPAGALLATIRFYQRFISPAIPVVTLGQCACRFTPTCSHYAAEAIQTHGAARGTWLAICRLVKCTPLHPGGEDPVPARRSPRCTTVRRNSSDVPRLSSAPSPFSSHPRRSTSALT